MKYLQKEIKLNFKLIVILLLINVITIGMYYSYALFELSVIENNIVVIKTATIDIVTKIENYSTPSITLTSGETKEITITLTNDLKRDIAYKMYYEMTGSSTFTAKVYEYFEENIIEGVMNTSKTIKLTLQNTGSSSITLTLGTKGGVKGHEVILDKGIEIPITARELVAGDVFNKSVKNLINNTTDATYKSEDTKITYIGFYENTIPEGYTKETLENLPYTYVSLDEKIRAYNDNGKVYVYSTNEIIANSSMYSMFREMKGLTKIDLLELDTSNVVNMQSIFQNLSSLESLDLSNFDTNKVTNMSSMFDDSSLESLDVSNFNTSNVTTMRAMFDHCDGLTSLDLSNFDTSNVEDMYSMFNQCNGLTTLDLSNFDTANVENMGYMFYNLQNLQQLIVNNFDTSKVTTMDHMFASLPKITELDLSSFDTQKVTNMTKMFKDIPNLKTVYVSDKWNVANVTASTDMFTASVNLVGENGTKYNSSYVDKTYARIDTIDTPGYFTYKEYVKN